MKTEVYSWRLSVELKDELAEQARRRKSSMADLLQEIAREWLTERRGGGDAGEQKRLHAAARRCFGTIELAHSGTAANVRRIVGERLQATNARRRAG